MPKSLFVDPEQLFAKGELDLGRIAIRSYDRALADERALRGDAALIRCLRHMMVVREFETMLGDFKNKGAYRGIDYAYKGPAHLSVGQEAVCVGQAMALTPEDHVFGSHRSHGEFIAKGLAAIHAMSPEACHAALHGHDGGALLALVEGALGSQGQDLAEDVLIYGLLAEIFMKATGFNGGMGGSMHAFFTPFGAYPNNAIVGASAGIAAGAALRKKLARQASITVANAGDGSTGCGPVWEAMNFAAMGQFDTLWDDALKGGLPVLFSFANNFYAMGGQTIGETMAWEKLSRIGAGINAHNLHAETVDGTDPLAVADAVARKRQLLLDGQGPALLDIECYRSVGHSTSDAMAYRTREELAAWEAHDPIAKFAARLIAEGVITEETRAAMADEVAARMEAVVRLAVDPEKTPGVDLVADPLAIGRMMFSDEAIELPAARAPLLRPPEETTTFKQIGRKARFGLDAEGKPLSGMRAITLRDALSEAITHHMIHDERLVAWGEECRDWGGAFGVYRGLSDFLPYERLFNSPISEAVIVAAGVGLALEGGRALVELMYGDFLGRAGDEVFNQMAKWQSMSAGRLQMPVVLRLSVGSKYGAQHSQDWTAMCAHVPGLKVVYPATPADARGLMAEALSLNDPTVFFESQRLYDQVEIFEPEGVPTDYVRIPFGKAALRREGSDVTFLTIGPSLYHAMKAADELEAMGISAEVIDLRSLVPFDYETVLASVRKTGRVVLVSEAAERGSFTQTVAATITRHAFGDLKAPPRVLGTPNWIVPGADMEVHYFPQAADIIDIVTNDFYPERRINRAPRRDWDDLDLAARAL